jgi:hypothetical protein
MASCQLDVNLYRRLPKQPVVGNDTYKKALSRLASDVQYRMTSTKNPNVIMSDYPLSVKELSSLRSAAVLSGADVSAVDSLVSAAIGLSASGTDGPSIEGVDVSCCSCCCCCCGETAVAPGRV